MAGGWICFELSVPSFQPQQAELHDSESCRLGAIYAGDHARRSLPREL